MSHHIAEMSFLIVVGCSPVGFRRGMHAPATGATGLEEEPAERWPILTAARSGPNVPDDTPGSAIPPSADLVLLGIDAVAARSRTVLERLIELIVRNGLVRTDRSPRTVRSDARLGDEGMGSSAASALVNPSATAAESPKPRRSTANTRWLAVSSGIRRWNANHVSGNPCTSRIGEPLLPAETCAWRSPFLVTS